MTEDSGAALQRWRSWAQFVFHGGGPVTLTDVELQAAVCVRVDVLENHEALLDACRELAALSDETIDEGDPAILGGFRDAARALIAKIDGVSETSETRPRRAKPYQRTSPAS